MGRLTGRIRLGSFRLFRGTSRDDPRDDAELPLQEEDAAEEAAEASAHPLRERSIRAQWMTQTVSVTVLILFFSVGVFSVATSSLLLTNMRSNLSSRVGSAVNFFNQYASASDAELYAGAKDYIEGYEDRNIGVNLAPAIHRRQL